MTLLEGILDDENAALEFMVAIWGVEVYLREMRLAFRCDKLPFESL